MTKLRELMGIVKDKASQGKAAMLSNRATLSLLRATTHDSSAPPTRKHISAVLSFGDGSRASASAAIKSLMDRLQSTQNSAVALKCLLAVHRIINQGSFILQDQLSVCSSTGGRNYLNLSNFRDSSTPVSWELSTWVRWYAQYIEQLLCTCRVLGYFLSTPSSDTTQQEEILSGLINADLLAEIEALLALIEEIGKRPDPASTSGNKLVDEIVNLVSEDWISIIREVWVRVNEFRERVGSLSFGEAVDLVRALKRLEESKERMKLVTQGFWGLVGEVKEKAGMEANREDGKGIQYKTVGRHRSMESDRFATGIVKSAALFRFPSGRLL